MLLIVGVKVRYRPMEAGTFHCPDEGGDRGYTLLEARRWFTLFFIPLIRFGVLGYVVECDSCRHRFDQRTLHLPTSATMEHKIDVAARSLFGAVGAASPGQCDGIAVEMEGFLGGPTYSASDLIAHARIQTSAQRHEALAAAGEVMDPAGRETMLMAAARAAIADGVISDRQREILIDAGASLGMTPVHVEGVMTVALRRLVPDEDLRKTE